MFLTMRPSRKYTFYITNGHIHDYLLTYMCVCVFRNNHFTKYFHSEYMIDIFYAMLSQFQKCCFGPLTGKPRSIAKNLYSVRLMGLESWLFPFLAVWS